MSGDLKWTRILRAIINRNNFSVRFPDFNDFIIVEEFKNRKAVPLHQTLGRWIKVVKYYIVPNYGLQILAIMVSGVVKAPCKKRT